MLQRSRRLLFPGLLLLGLPALLAGCLPPANSTRPAIDPRYLRAMTAYYNLHAAEPGCPKPQIVAFSALALLNSISQTNSVRMRGTYTFTQFAPDGTSVCQGAGDRYFSFFKSSKGPEVIGMTGPLRPT